MNPFSLDRKLNNQKKYEMIYMLRKECMPSDFYRYIFTEESFLYLNGKTVLYPKVAEIIWKFIRVDEKNYNKLRNNLCQFKNIFQYVYSNVYPEVYCSAERRSFDLRSAFHLLFKSYKSKGKLEQSGKNLQKYTIERNESFAFELKPVEIDMFHDKEENEVKESVEKRKKKQQGAAEKKQSTEATKKGRERKKDEKELWARLKTINKEFKNINESKTKNKKTVKNNTNINCK